MKTFVALTHLVYVAASAGSVVVDFDGFGFDFEFVAGFAFAAVGFASDLFAVAVGFAVVADFESVVGFAFVAADFAFAAGSAFAVDSAFVDFATAADFAFAADSATAVGSVIVVDSVIAVDFASVAVDFVFFGYAATDVAAIRFGSVFVHSRTVRRRRCPDTRYNRVKLADRCSPAGIQARRFPNAVHSRRSFLVFPPRYFRPHCCLRCYNPPNAPWSTPSARSFVG